MTDLLGPRGRAELGRVARASSLLAFDFDGTLAPIVADVRAAAMRPGTRELLAEVAARYPCAILSGRRISDLRPRFRGIPVRFIVGNHGAEGSAPVPGQRRLRARVAGWSVALSAALDGRAGVWIEDKGLSLSVHYRDAPDRPATRRSVLRLARALASARSIPGKCVVSLVPVEAPDKGEALARLAARTGARRVLFAGDDDTDEDAFRADLGVPVTTIRVGGGPSCARFGLGGQDGVDEMLRILLSARSGTAGEAG